MSDSGFQPIIDVAVAAASPVPLDPSVRYAVTAPDSDTVQIIEPVADSKLDVPRRLTGEFSVDDVDSLQVVWEKFSDSFSEVYASEKLRKVIAVFDADVDASGPRHRDHRVSLTMEHTPQWLAWQAISGKWMTQMDFSEFLEDRAVDLESPSPADALDLAQHFEATTRVDFESAERTSSSQRTLVYKETIQAKAGQSGQLEIPTEFVITVKPYVASPFYRVVARFRYRIVNGTLSLMVVLVRADEVLQNAFTDVVTEVSESLSATVIRGTPPVPVC